MNLLNKQILRHIPGRSIMPVVLAGATIMMAATPLLADEDNACPADTNPFISTLAHQDEGITFPARETERKIWSLIEDSKYGDALPSFTGPSTLRAFANIAINKLMPCSRKLTPKFMQIAGVMNPDYNTETFTHHGDYMPKGRTKEIHAQGTSILVRWVPSGNSHPFTGIFATGADFGIARFSYAAPPSATETTPGMGLKFWKDNKESVNLLAMYSLAGQESYNMFENTFTTNVPKPAHPDFAKQQLAKSFETTLHGRLGDKTSKVNHLSVMHFAKENADGTSVNNPVAPDWLEFVPTSAAKALMANDSTIDFRKQLDGKGANIVLYEIWAVTRTAAPEGKEGTVSTHIGTLETKDVGFVASHFGDHGLFFRHYSPAVEARENGSTTGHDL